MTFEDFAHAHGLIFQGLVMGRWMSTPTEDHPHKRNGRYKWLGNVGWVQNWATMEKPEIWRGEGNIVTVLRQDNQEREQKAEQAASKAAWLLHQARLDTHPYLRSKGFPDEAGNVWEQKLVVPMRMNGRLAGAQLIDDQGVKKFLYGQKSKGASFVIDAKGIPIFCEGYATGLSVRVAMKAMKVRYTIHVCFSASNVQTIAREIERGIVVADNDPNGIGVKAARDAGKPYWLSPTVGEDFNDFHQRVGLYQASASLKKALFA